MIQGFSEKTQPLSQYEMDVLTPLIVQGMKGKVGKNRAITNRAICSALKNNGYKIDSVRLRKIINYIRVHGLVKNIIATNDGYYIATSRAEVVEYLKGLENREGAIHNVRESLSEQMMDL